MTTFCVAYKNEYTTKIHEAQGNLCGGWVRISAFVSFDEAHRIFEARKEQFGENTAIGIFCENGNDAWYSKRPRYLHNRHVIFSAVAVQQAFGGLINSAHAGMF